MTTTPAPAETKQAESPAPRPLPAIARWLVLVPSAVGVPVSLFVVFLCLTYLSKPVWGLFGFEVALAVSCVLGVLLGLGKFRRGWALGSLCIAGAFAAAALFGWYIDARSILKAAVAGGDAPAWARTAAEVGFYAHATAAGLCGLAAVSSAFGRRPKAWSKFALAVLLMLPVVAIGAYLQFGSGVEHITNPTTGVLEVVRIVGTVLGGFAVVVLISVSGHLAIRAFETALPDQQGA